MVSTYEKAIYNRKYMITAHQIQPRLTTNSVLYGTCTVYYTAVNYCSYERYAMTTHDELL